jgi:GNAT superfamily N-acetyltransferase
MKHDANAQRKVLGWQVRSADPGDVAQLVSLSNQLGYSIEAGQLTQQLSLILARNDHAIFVAVSPDDHVQGWIHIFERPLLMQTTGAELGGLVVEEQLRGQGIGRALLSAAEQWVQANELTHLTIRSNTSRTAAHAFYQELDYEHVKTSNVFKKVFLISA